MRRQTGQQAGRQNRDLPQQLRRALHRHFVADHQPFRPAAAEKQSDVKRGGVSALGRSRGREFRRFELPAGVFWRYYMFCVNRIYSQQHLLLFVFVWQTVVFNDMYHNSYKCYCSVWWYLWMNYDMQNCMESWNTIQKSATPIRTRKVIAYDLLWF